MAIDGKSRAVTLPERADSQYPAVATADEFATAQEVVDALLGSITDGLDHPEIWAAMPSYVAAVPGFAAAIAQRDRPDLDSRARVPLQILSALVQSVVDGPRAAYESLASHAASAGRSTLFEGALFHLAEALDSDNPKYRLAGRICPTPFVQIDVSSTACHLCCPGWLETPAGDPRTRSWEEIWNGEAAQSIRASILDGSYRHCNKGICPTIQGNALVPAEEIRTQSPFWQSVIDEKATTLPQGPEWVNLAYDATCNLSCPSCRTKPFAADRLERLGYEQMQERTILPMLKTAKMAYVTGSGDPFASKTFRQLIKRLTAEEYPALTFYVMTNGMLLTPRQWAEFPSLHGRVDTLRISIDAATGETHERLRRGARWPVMLENMKFAGALQQEGLVDNYELAFTVQVGNYSEMGDAVDLAKSVGATRMSFFQLTNWGTFTEEEYFERAVFLPSHPKFADFLLHMQDERLRSPIVALGNMREFAEDPDPSKDRQVLVTAIAS